MVPGQILVPYPSCGHTFSEHDAVAEGTHLPLPEGAKCCEPCGQVVVHDLHSSGQLHPKIKEDAADVRNKPTAASAVELPNAALAALCQQWMAADPGFAALVSQAGPAAQMAGDELAPQPPPTQQPPEQHVHLLNRPAGHAARADVNETGLPRPMSPQHPGQEGEFSGALANSH